MAADLAAASGVKVDRDTAALAAGGGGATEAPTTGATTPAAGDTLRACTYLYVAASVPALRLMRGYTAARSWSAARALLLLLLTGQAGIGCDVAVEGIAAAVASVVLTAANREFDHRARQRRQLA
jgi:hypothetical protein